MDEILNLIKRFEGCRLKAYLCPAGVWTVGWGSTGPDIGPLTQWTQEQADVRLYKDVYKFYNVVIKLAPSATVSTRMALTDFAYNLGLGALKSSTLLKKVNINDMDASKVEIMKWVHGGGKILPGLIKRRAAEANLLI